MRAEVRQGRGAGPAAPGACWGAAGEGVNSTAADEINQDIAVQPTPADITTAHDLNARRCVRLMTRLPTPKAPLPTHHSHCLPTAATVPHPRHPPFSPPAPAGAGRRPPPRAGTTAGSASRSPAQRGGAPPAPPPAKWRPAAAAAPRPPGAAAAARLPWRRRVWPAGGPPRPGSGGVAGQGMARR